MSLERADFQKTLEESRRERVRRRAREIRQVAQAAAPAEILTGSQEWDYFITLLQSQIDTLQKILMALRDSAASDLSFEHSDLARYKAQEMRISAQIDTLQQIIALPKQIIEQGEKAKLVLKQYADE